MLMLAALARELSWFPPAPVQPSLVVVPALAVGWLGAVWMRGGYEQAVLGAGVDEYKRVLQASVMIVAFVGILCYLARYPLPRSFFLLAFFMVCAALLAGRFTLRLVVRRARRKGAMLHRVLVVGTTSHADDVVKVLERERWLGYDIVGVVNAGSASAIVSAVGRVQADVVFLAGGAVESSDDVRRIAWELESRHTRVVVAPGLTEVAPERVRLRPVAGVPLIHLDKPRAAGAVRSAKRIFDVVGASILLVAFSPLFAFSAWQIRRHDGGPLLFSHERVGRDGVPFGCLKFRTMVVDAQAQLAAVHADLGEEVGIFYKIKDDPRITPPGRWMRRFSVDELPQLLNVLRGDMSLVGPRPQIADEVALYDDAHGPPPARAPRHDRPLAGLRPLGPLPRGLHAPGPLLRRQLVDEPGRRHPQPDGPRRLRVLRRLLRLERVHPRQRHERATPWQSRRDHCMRLGTCHSSARAARPSCTTPSTPPTAPPARPVATSCGGARCRRSARSRG